MSAGGNGGNPAIPTTRVPILSSDVWFNDGNIVLQAEAVMFKVYQGMLCQESKLFQDMFSLPQPTPIDDSLVYDGCQVVELHESSEDLRVFLSAIFIHHFLDKSCSALELAALLKLSGKYQAEALRRRVIAILLTVFPDKLENEDSVMRSFSPLVKELRFRWPSSKWLSRTVAIMNAARQTEGAQILLPSAYLHAYKRGLPKLLATPDIDPANLFAMLEARPRISDLARAHSFSVLFSDSRDVSPTCAAPEQCHVVRRELMHKVERPPLFYDPFFVVDCGEGSLVRRFCDSCRGTFEMEYQAGRQVAWDALPERFKLPSWGELRLRAVDLDRKYEKDLSW